MKTKKRFKPLAVLMAVCMLFQLGGVSIAFDEVYVEYEVFGIDDELKAQQIINAISGQNSGSTYEGISPASVLCIFAHSLAQSTVRETTHRVWSAQPRCRQITYRVNYCTRSSCNHIVYTQTGNARISCCA